MAQTGYTPILIYSSSTGGSLPVAGNLTNSTLGSELAINITDGKLFYKDNANAIQVIGWKTVPTTAGGTGLTSYTAGDLVYYASGTTFTKLAIGANTTILTSTGTAPQWTAQSSLSVGTATNLAGGAQGSIPYQSGASTTVFLAKNTTATRYLANTGTNNNPDWAQINLANGVTGTLPVGNGGTGITSLTTNYIPYGNNTSAFQSSANLQYNGTTLAVGGTISAWASNTVVQTTGASMWGASGVGHISTNTYFDGTNYVYIATNFVEDYYQLNGAHVFRSANSGTAGTNVTTFTNLINVDIGKTLALQGGTQSTGCGIAFPATQSASTNANTLDDYVEGTFTPTLISTTGTITTVGTTTGQYTKIGNQVVVVLFLPITTNGTGAGALRVTNMPFTCNATASSYGAGREQNVTGNGIFGYINANTKDLYLQRYDGAYPGGTGYGVGFTITYFV